MSENDPLLQFLSRDASSPAPRAAEGYKITVVVGGARFTGHVLHPDSFLEDLLPSEELRSRYRASRHAEQEADDYLHLIVSASSAWPTNTNRHVRFRMDGIDAWWAE